jgi:thymidylate synthase (FAD)
VNIISPGFFIEGDADGERILKSIERAGRVCYKSECRITSDSALEFVRKVITSGHESVIEHVSMTVRIICDRGVSHEIVRHRIASYSQESTRYCTYGDGKRAGEVTFIRPCFWEEGSYLFKIWESQMRAAESCYASLLANGATAQQARSVLPNSLKTEIVMTANLREWRHFFKLRTSVAAHPQMREIAIPMLKEFQRLIPVVFDDIQTGEKQ